MGNTCKTNGHNDKNGHKYKNGHSDKNDKNDKNDNKINRRKGNVYIYKGGKVNDKDKQNIEHVHIDESVSVIHDQAFAQCTNLQTVEYSIPKNHNKNINNMLKKIGNESFCECYNLLSINLSDIEKLETIGDRAFFCCEKLMTVQFPSSIRHIGYSSFYGCHQLQVIDVSHAKHLVSIEERAFAHCSVLRTVSLPPAMSQIREQSFHLCDSLEILDIRDACIKEIGTNAFYYCRNLTTICFPKTTRCIGEYSFSRCQKLSTLELQATSIESIGDEAFSHCYDVKTIKFPKTLQSIGKECFRNCTELVFMNLHETSIERMGNGVFMHCKNLKTVFGLSTTNQEDDYDKIQQEIMDDGTIPRYDDIYMQLPASLVEIGKDCFSYCPKLKRRIDNNRIHYICDINRGGRRFIKWKYHNNVDSKNDDTNKDYVGKVYYRSLWPLILHRVVHEVKLPQHIICSNGDNLSLYVYANPFERRVSIIFYLLIHGLVADLQAA